MAKKKSRDVLGDAVLPDEPKEYGDNASSRIRSFVERVERLMEDRRMIGDDIKEVMSEAKSEGFDTKILRKVIQIRKKDRADRMEEEALLDLYLKALGEK